MAQGSWLVIRFFCDDVDSFVDSGPGIFNLRCYFLYALYR